MLTVSVCIANYKQDQFLREAIASIEMQTYKDVETILTRLDKQDQKTYELEQHILAILQAVDKPAARSKSKTAGGAE